MHIIKKIKEDSERGARVGLIEELFYDFNKSRKQVYWINFVRGIFFGFGALIGGTILVAVIVWTLNQFTEIFPIIDDFIKIIQK